VCAGFPAQLFGELVKQEGGASSFFCSALGVF